MRENIKLAAYLVIGLVLYVVINHYVRPTFILSNKAQEMIEQTRLNSTDIPTIYFYNGDKEKPSFLYSVELDEKGQMPRKLRIDLSDCEAWNSEIHFNFNENHLKTLSCENLKKLIFPKNEQPE